MWRRAVMALVCVSLAAGGGAGVSGVAGAQVAAVSSASPSVPLGAPGAPAELLASAIAATDGAPGFRLSEAVEQAGRTVVSLSARAGRSSGTATETLRLGSRMLRLTILQVGARLYFSANLAFFEAVLGYAPRVARKLEGKWVRLDDNAGLGVAADFTVPALSSLLDLVGNLKMLPVRSIGGHRTVGLTASRQTPSGLSTESIYVSAKAPHYPVVIRRLANGTESQMVFSDWATQSIPAPIGAVSLPAPSSGS